MTALPEIATVSTSRPVPPTLTVKADVAGCVVLSASLVGQHHLVGAAGPGAHERRRGVVHEAHGRREHFGDAVAGHVLDRVRGQVHRDIGVGTQKRRHPTSPRPSSPSVESIATLSMALVRAALLHCDPGAADRADGLAEGQDDLRQVIRVGVRARQRRLRTPSTLWSESAGLRAVVVVSQLPEGSDDKCNGLELRDRICPNRDAVVVVPSVIYRIGAHESLGIRAYGAVGLRVVYSGPICRVVELPFQPGGRSAGVAPRKSQVFVEGDRELDVLADDVGVGGGRGRGDRDRADCRRRVGRRPSPRPTRRPRRRSSPRAP